MRAAGGGVLWYGAHDGTAGQRVHAGRFRCAGRRVEDTGRQEPLFREGDTVDTVLAKMTLAEKVGQMFIVRCPEQGAAEKAAEYHLGGYILFRENFEEKTPVQAAEMVRACQAAAALPMLVGVDEEGGTVNRISGYPAFRDTPFASPQELYQAGGFDAVREDALEKCAFLEELGVNVNFAPVCDVSTDPEDFIYKRSFGRNAAETAQYVRTVVETMGERGMGSVLKHFPGYGNNADTHTGIAVDDRPYDSFAASDFLPFRAGIEAGADIVLVSHNIVSCMDSAYPASLSPRVHEILREELGFTGVTVTDDLYMDGIRDFVDVEGAAVQAVLAGNDLLCCTDFEVQIPAVLAAVEQGGCLRHELMKPCAAF
ncbi:MAG: glycoside hydrolase family 3 N-terminal domain-containing protein [Ruthenibacterium lactatiformans]